MKIAYLTSCYPAVSHTFIAREIEALRERGLQISTFSVRRPAEHDMIDKNAREEARITKWLVPPSIGALAVAMAWSIITRPIRLCRAFASATLKRNETLKQRLLWSCYLIEAVLLAYWLGNEQCDHLHCHFGNSGANTGMLAAMLADIPFSMTCHGSELNEVEHFRLPDKVASASFVACVSHYGRAQLMLACPPEQWSKLHVVRCGLKSIGHRAAHSPAGEKPNVLCVGRLSKEKGHLILLDAIAELRKRGLKTKLTLVGDGPMRETIKSRIQTLGLNSDVTLTGALDPESVASQYAQADVVVLASFSEGVPVVLMEAMAHGLPVVATRVGGVPELVEHASNGVLVAPGNIEELAAGLERVLSDRAFASTIGDEAIKTICNRFLIGPSAEQLIGLFRHLRANQEQAPQRESQPLRSNEFVCLEES
ncbi:MAG: glycosyltransferase family 4 protein [Planctomycetes bacterium]|nr:glycosyltransferase family 4 protein [Planctomycetota bacterium]